MALTAVTYPGFTPDASIGTSFGTTSSNVALPGTPSGDTLVLMTNIGSWPIFVVLGTSNAVAATVANGVPVLPGQQLFLVRGANTWIAGIIVGGMGSGSTTFITTGN
jgi:hypothetical protein